MSMSRTRPLMSKFSKFYSAAKSIISEGTLRGFFTSLPIIGYFLVAKNPYEAEKKAALESYVTCEAEEPKQDCTLALLSHVQTASEYQGWDDHMRQALAVLPTVIMLGECSYQLTLLLIWKCHPRREDVSQDQRREDVSQDSTRSILAKIPPIAEGGSLLYIDLFTLIYLAITKNQPAAATRAAWDALMQCDTPLDCRLKQLAWAETNGYEIGWDKNQNELFNIFYLITIYKISVPILTSFLAKCRETPSSSEALLPPRSVTIVPELGNNSEASEPLQRTPRSP